MNRQDCTQSVALTPLAGDPSSPWLVVGPSLGTAVRPLWGDVAAILGRRWHVVGWDLPGHGATAQAVEPQVVEPLTLRDLASAVLRAVPVPEFVYAGDSVGAAVGLQLLLDASERVGSAVLCCTGAKIGDSAAWRARADAVDADGTRGQIAGSRERWFGPGFAEREPAKAAALLRSLAETDARGYAAVCRALADFDVRARLAEITAPVLAIAGSHDAPTPPASLQQIADGVQHGRMHLLQGVGHLAPAEAPLAVAELCDQHFRRDRVAAPRG